LAQLLTTTTYLLVSEEKKFMRRNRCAKAESVFAKGKTTAALSAVAVTAAAALSLNKENRRHLGPH
jgi:hypothetical protein